MTYTKMQNVAFSLFAAFVAATLFVGAAAGLAVSIA